MKIEIEIEISREVLEDIFVTAIEGGSNYWLFLPKNSVKAIRNAVPKDVDPYISTAILKAILDHDVKVAINDAENKDDVVGVIRKDLIQPRLQLLAQSDLKWALEAHMNEQGDGDTADIVFQYLTIGEVVYG